MEQMYKGMPFSPTATLTANIAATDTIIPVSDVDAFPDAPNIATIGSIAGPNETIIYTGKTTTSLTGCTRGVEGAASDWAVDELIGRNFTAKDHESLINNIKYLDENKLEKEQNDPSIEGTLAQKIKSNSDEISNIEGMFAEGNLVLYNGWTFESGSLVVNRIGNRVFIKCILNSGAYVQGDRIAILDATSASKCRPVTTEYIHVDNYDSSWNYGRKEIYINPDGEILSNNLIGANKLVIDASFYAPLD